MERALRTAVLPMAVPLTIGFLAAGCESSLSGYLSCGIDVCTTRQECVAGPDGPTCVCTEGFEDAACTRCASGYEQIGSRCQRIAIDCAETPNICGPHGTCVAAADGDTCQCDEAAEGVLCERCASGYQDNDDDGTCRPTCAEAALGCQSPSRCADHSGAAVCECPTGYTGDDCSLCALGYRHTGTACVATCDATDRVCPTGQICIDAIEGARCECPPGHSGAGCQSCAEGFRRDPSTGACLPTCAGAAPSCGPHGRCDDSVGFARCVCDLGYAGQSCDECAEGFESDAERVCRRTPGADDTLLFAGTYAGRSVVATLNPSSAEAVPLVELTLSGLSGLSGLSADAGAGTFLFNSAGVISIYSLASVSAEPLVSGSGALGPLAWSAAESRVYAIGGQSEAPLLSIDPAANTVVELFDTGIAGAQDLALDAPNQRLLVLRDSLFSVSLVDGAVSRLGAAPPGAVGIELAEDGSVLVLSATDADLAAARVQACRATAEHLSLTGYTHATGRFVQPAEDTEAVRLEAATSESLELISYLGRGGVSLPRTIDVQVDNPEALLCLALEEDSRIVVAAGARFRALVVYSADATVELDLDDATGGSAAEIFLGGYAPSFAYSPQANIVEYTRQEWVALELPIDPRFHRPGPGVLHQLDASFAPSTSMPLVGSVVPAGPLSTWLPAAP